MNICKSICVLGLGLGLIGCASARRPSEPMSAASLASAGYLKYWEVDLPFEKGETVREATLVDENLYVTSSRGYFYAVQAEEGLLRWMKDITRPEYTIYRPSHLNSASGPGPLCVVTTTKTVLLDRYTGDVLRQFVPEFAPGSGAVGDDTRLYYGGADGLVHCLSWNHPFGARPMNRWEVEAGGPVRAAPVLFGDRIIVASQGGLIMSLVAFDKRFNWRARTEDAIIADPWVDAGGVYVASLDRSLYKFDAFTGAQKWRFRFPRPLTTPPVVTRSTVYQYAPTVGLTAIDADLGDERWVRADAVAFVAMRPGEVVLLTERGTLEAVDGDTGQTIRDLGATGIGTTVPNVRDDRIIALTADGKVFCARPDTTPYLRRQQVLAAQDRLESAPNTAQDAPPPPPAPQASSRDPFRSERDK
ncbi:MAG: PQQ-binding-like beta-propeller repeat protein [Phycisphaerae bacterium]|nr:MAG: hypothetical protein EDS66_13775 [Planctomycetota bacterium]KAB2941484.1 MAG: PQQ-binding-like beta-propeller repeat protein [Phycisphaerae bacterium]MBE7455020.1 PQQ-binding-like beta-propeller repeat protein [Planctomycetia bacterium]MCK6464745.1 PQQ-like beta-propeller repeat protein [Phycisphaerae bacterium]MCL4718919.1 PQQ-binding-like beta-propeller repeat protein [Phycisphaerae bacterium]